MTAPTEPRMSNLIRFHQLLAASAVWLSVLLGTGTTAHAAVDTSVTQRVWKLKFGVTDAQMYVGGNSANGLNMTWLNGDADGDGIKNIDEITAGTNPFNPGKTIAITSVTRNGGNVELQFPTETGKLYRVEFTTTLANAGSWALHASPTPGQWIGNGSPQMFTLPYAANTFYRIRVDELDSDGDGVSDWVEAETSLNPNSATTVTGVNDHDYVSGQLALPSVVSIHATKPFASEDGPDAGTFTVSRTQKLLPITINLTRTGTAVAGSDYSALPASVSFTPGVDSIQLPVNPIPDAPTPVVEGSKSVTASLQAPGGAGSPGFTLGANATATVIIKDSTVPSGTGLLARYYDHSNGTYAHGANFGDLGTYFYDTGGTITIPYSKTPAVQVGNVVRVSFNDGVLNNALYSNQNYTVSAVSPTDFTLAITGANLPTSDGGGNCYFSIQSFPHPAVVERIDPTVDFVWLYGLPNNNSIAPSDSPDNWSAVWEGYLHPTTAGSYRFQLDADDKARVLLDLNNNGIFEAGEEIVEHGWDGAATPETVGTFKISSSYALAVPAAAANRYKIRVEMVETTDDARCRLQWSLNGGGFTNIPQANVFSHVAVMNANYSYTRTVATAGAMKGIILVTLNGHGLAVNDTVDLSFSSGNLFTPTNGNFHGTFTVTLVNSANTFTVNIAAPTLPSSSSGTGYVLNRPTTTNPVNAWYNLVWSNTSFSGAPGRVSTNNNGTNDLNNGIWGSGTPAPNQIGVESFSARWSGQVQPQFSEEYTFTVVADDGCTLKINGVVQDLKMAPAANTGGSTYTYDSATGNTVVNYTNSALKPNNVVVGETLRLDAANGVLALGNNSTYTYDSTTGDAVIDYSNLTNVTPGGFAVGEMVEVDPTSGNVNLVQLPYQITAATATTFTVNFGAGLFPSGSGLVNVSDILNRVVTAVTPTSFTVNFDAGNYASGTGNMNFDFVNKSLKDWSSNGNERYVRIPMLGGVRYDIELDYWENNNSSQCRLFWYSLSQPKQIIPAERLYPASGSLAPASFTSPTDATALVGGSFNYDVEGSNGATVAISGNPAWLTYSNGVLSGTPPAGAAGDYQVVVTLTSATGTSTSVINLRVEDTGSTVVREFWNGVAGTSVASIPVNNPPSGTANLTSLEAPENFGDDYGSRIRGYITAPETGNYYFWIAANNQAELWISNDDEPVNSIKRAWVANGTASQQWGSESNQKSPWLALEAGQRYYFEVLQKAGVGSGDNLAIGWLKPNEAGTTPSEVVPGYVLSPYVAPAPGSTPGTLYLATMLSQNGAVTNGVGTSTLRLSDDENYGYMKRSYGGLSGPITAEHIHTDPYLSKPSTIVFDIDEPVTPGDGLITNPADPNYTGTDPQTATYKWTILPVGTLSKADIIEIIKQGKSYVNLHTALYPNGEIRGNYTLANGSRTFTVPPAPPAWTNDHTTNNAAARFLTQATFGPSVADIAALKAMASYEAWIDDQFTKPVSYQLPEVMRTANASVQGGEFEETLTFNAWWKNSITGPDQLRQRIAFALSEILVVSAQGPLDNRAEALSFFYDKLAEDAFGNFRNILETTTKTWTMGRYLDMWRNDKPDPTVGRIPNENYAREIKQLFSIGLYRMWPDGTLILNSKDSPIDTYTQREIVGFAHVFTGWDYGYDGALRTAFGAPTDFTRLMREVPARHFTGPKRLLNNEVLPGLPTLGNQPLDPYATHNTQHFGQTAYQNLPEQELDISHDQLFNHPNVGPFICRQLIQRLVTSHPSRDYLYRVVQKFNDNGAGVRGDMKAVIKAILLDYEARSSAETTKPAYGKQREPVMRVAAAGRAFRTDSWSGTYSQTGTRTITVTTATPHKLETNNSVFLDFTSGSPAPWIGAYAATVTGANTFTVTAQGWSSVVNYSIPANSTTCTVTYSGHWVAAGNQIYVDFLTGTNMPADGIYAVSDPNTGSTTQGTAEDYPSFFSGNSFNITVTANASARSGTLVFPRFAPGSYAVSASGLAAPNDRRITMDTNFNHELAVGDKVWLNFYNAANLANLPADFEATVESTPDVNTWTFLASSTAFSAINNNYDAVYQFPLKSLPQTRNGNLSSRPSTFNMGNTDGDIDQSPLNSITVFNFFLPDYKFPGTLASQGITTPEFQTTAETTLIRQSNFLFNGIFNPGNTNGISSFKSGSNALVMDFSPWMGNAVSTAGTVGATLGAGPQTGQAWTSNANLSTLIDRLSTLLLGGQLPAGAKTRIMQFIGSQVASITTATSPNACTFNMSSAHGLLVGDSVTVTGISGGTWSGASTTGNGTFVVTEVPTATSFKLATALSGGTTLRCTSTSGISLTNSTAGIIAYTNSAPTDTNKRDRLRAIIHLILTSPDFTIQR